MSTATYILAKEEFADRLANLGYVWSDMVAITVQRPELAHACLGESGSPATDAVSWSEGFDKD